MIPGTHGLQLHPAVRTESVFRLGGRYERLMVDRPAA